MKCYIQKRTVMFKTVIVVRKQHFDTIFMNVVEM